MMMIMMMITMMITIMRTPYFGARGNETDTLFSINQLSLTWL